MVAHMIQWTISRVFSILPPMEIRTPSPIKTTYPQKITTGLSWRPGILANCIAAIAVAQASAQPGMARSMNPAIVKTTPQKVLPGASRMNPIVIGSPVTRV